MTPPKELTIEDYILSLIKKRERDLKELESNRKDYSVRDYQSLFHRWHGALSDLYMTLTAYNNPSSQITL